MLCAQCPITTIKVKERDLWSLFGRIHIYSRSNIHFEYIYTGKPLGNTILFFGCRHEAEDYIYEEELKDFHQQGVLSELSVAFSRDQPQKIYVQNKLTELGKKIWELLESQGYFYVCG